MKLGRCNFMILSVDASNSSITSTDHYTTTDTCWWQFNNCRLSTNAVVLSSCREGNETSYSNSTILYLDPDRFIHAVAVSVLLSSISGFALNGIVIAISLSRKRSIAGEYKYFVLNASLVGCVRCLLYPNVTYSLLWHHPEINSLASYASFTNMTYVFIFLPITINRYICILFNHVYQQWFSKRNILLLCAISDLLIFATPLLLELNWFGGRIVFKLLAGFGAQLFQVTDKERWVRAAALMMAMQLTALLIDAIVVLLNGRVVRHLRRHAQATTLTIMTAERLAKNRTIIRAMLMQVPQEGWLKQLDACHRFQALLPILPQLPLLILSIVSVVTALTYPSKLFGMGSFKAYLNVIVFASSMALPALDAIITLTMVKQYRERFLLLFCTKQKVAPEAAAQLPLQQQRPPFL